MTFSALPPCLLVLLVTSIFASTTHSTKNTFKILLLTPMSSKSHKIVFIEVVEELSNRGHQITLISPYEPTKKMENVQEIVVQQKQLVDPDILKHFYNLIGINPVASFPMFKSVMVEQCETFLQNQQILDMIKAGKQYDVVIVDAILQDCALAISPLVGKTIMMLSTSVHIPWISISVPQPWSSVPNLMLPLTDDMTFWQRLHNALTIFTMQIVFKYYMAPAIQSVVMKHIPEAPTLQEVMRNVTFVLVNSDPVLHSSQPSMPHIVNVGGMHCGKTKPLPKEFEDFVNNAGEDGFIMFSLGSVMQARYLPIEKKSAIIAALAKLKHKVIWKYEEDLENLPSNVKVTKWLPQRDLLAHPKCRLFITHGGLLSLEESVYHAVPLIGIAIFAEQPGNVARIRQLGIGEELYFWDITADFFYEKIKKVLDDKSYANNMKKYSTIFHEEIRERPKQKASFWIEYVARHNGVNHLRGPEQDLDIFQYFLLDIAAFVALISFVNALIMWKICKLLLHQFHLRYSTNTNF